MSAASERPEISIVIPSRDNRERLSATLESARRLELDPSRFEVLVEDDGSTDGTMEAFRDRRYPFRFEIRRGEHGNQSAATNAAAARATGRVLLCAASDLIFDPQLLTRHLEMHRRHGERRVAVLGHLPYLPKLAERPFMYYLMHGGPQFGYTQIRDPRRLGPNFCYAPNVSVRRDDFQRVDGFDPFFRYGGQDTDFGYRLAADGVRLVYEPDAVAWHDHPADVAGYASRQHAAGVSSALLAERYPTLEGGAPLWDAAIGAWLVRPEAILELDRRTIERIEPQVARAYPDYQRVWGAVAVSRSVDPAGLPDADRELFGLTRSLFSAYQRLVAFEWAAAFVATSIERLGAAAVGELIAERFLKLQTTVQARRVAERRLARLGIALTLVDDADLLDTLVLDGATSYDSAVRRLAPFVPPNEGRFNRELIVTVPRGALDDDQRRQLDELAELVESDSPVAGLLDALGRSRGDHVIVRDSDADDESAGARLVLERLFRRIPELRVVSGGVRDPAGRTVAGLDDGGGEISAAGAAGLAPVAAATPGHWAVRREDARRLAADAARLAELDVSALHAAIVGRLGGRACHVPDLLETPSHDAVGITPAN